LEFCRDQSCAGAWSLQRLHYSEVRDSGEFDRYVLYEHTKSLIASPPDVLRVDEKHMHEQAVFNVTGVIITTNDKNNGLYLPEEDRRHFVACSAAKISDFEPGYFSRLYGWYETGGYEAVAYYLANLDIAWFDPKAPPPKTQAFWDIVSASPSPEDAELGDAIDALGAPGRGDTHSDKKSRNKRRICRVAGRPQELAQGAAPHGSLWLSGHAKS
jgi:hypothetical protein